MLSLTPHAHPATPRLQLLHQFQQCRPGLRREDGTGHIDHIGFENFHQGEVFEQELRAAAGQIDDALPVVDVGGQHIHPSSPGAVSHRSRKDHFAAPAAQVEKLLACLESGQAADFQAGKIRCFSKTKVQKGSVGEGLALQVDVQWDEAPKIEKPHVAFDPH